MSETKRVINDLNVAKLILCNPQMLTPEMCIRIGQAITSFIALLKEQEVKMSVCDKCGLEHPADDRYCPRCGKSNFD